LVWIAYGVAAVLSIVSQFFTPAESALLPTVVGEGDLVAANSLTSLSRNLARLAGPALGGAVAAAVGIAGVTLIDSASFLIAAGLIALARVEGKAVREELRAAAGSALETWRSVWREWLEGVALVRRERLISVLLTVTAMSSLGEGVMSVMFVIWVKQVIHGGALQLGWFMSAQAVGGLLGGLIIGSLSRRLSPGLLAGAGMLLFGLLDSVLFGYPLFVSGIWLGLAVIVLVGVPVVAGGAGITTVLQTGVGEGYRGRVFGALGTTQGLFMLAGTLLAGVLGGFFGPIAMLVVMQGGLHVAVGLVLLRTLGGAVAPRTARQSLAAESS
jgi:MFS family permease